MQPSPPSISKILSLLQRETLSSLSSNFPFPNYPSSCNLYSFCLSEFAYFRDFIAVETYIFPFGPGFFHLAQYFQGSSCCSRYQSCFPSYSWIILHCMEKPYVKFIHSFVNEHLGCFCPLAIENNAAVYTDIQVCVWVSVFKSFGSIHGCHLESVEDWFQDP